MKDITDSLPEISEEKIIKVMGIGGGGCNAVNNMYSQGIIGVTFLVCNTDIRIFQSHLSSAVSAQAAVSLASPEHVHGGQLWILGQM